VLVTNVSLHPRRAAPLDVQVIETSAIKEILATQGLILAALVDEPAVADDTIDSYLGDIMLEAASADAVVTVTSTSSVLVDEPVTAEDSIVLGSGGFYAASLSESATADDLAEATGVGAAAMTTTSATLVGPLFAIDTTFSSASLTVIDAGQL